MAPTLLLNAWATTMWQACWQGSLVVLVVWMICRLLPRMPARVQCWFWRLAILKFLVVLLLPSLLELPLLPARPVVVREMPPQPVMEMPVAMELPASPVAQVPVDPAPAWELPRMPTLLFYAWLIGVGCCIARVAAAWYVAVRLRSQSRTIHQPRLIEQLAMQGRLFGLRRLPKLLEVAGGGSPMLIGVLRPAIVMPTETLGRLTISEQTMVLGHELAHVRRGDLFWGLAASVVRAVFFFHPLVWWSERQLKLVQEVAADELAIARQHHDPVGYGSLLVSVVGKLGRRPLVSTISVETAGTVHSLTRRLVAMTRIGPASRRVVIGSGVLLVAVVLLGLVPWRLVAAEPKEGEAQPRHYYHANLSFNGQKKGQPKKSLAAPTLVYHDGQWAFASMPYENDKTRLLMVTIAASPEGQPAEHAMQVLVISDPSGKELTKEDTDRLTKAAMKHVSNAEPRQNTVDLPKGSTHALTGSTDDKRLLNGRASIQVDGNGKFAVAQPHKDADYWAWKSPKVMFASESTGKVIIDQDAGSRLEIEVAVSPAATPANDESIPAGKISTYGAGEMRVIVTPKHVTPEHPLPPLPPTTEDQQSAAQTTAIAEIKKLGGNVALAQRTPTKPAKSARASASSANEIQPPGQAEAVAEIKRLGGRATGRLIGFRERRIVDVSLAGNKKITDDELRHLGKLPYLESLDLTGTRVTDKGLKYLNAFPHLVGLTLNDTQVTGTGFEDLKGMRLSSLGLAGTQVIDKELVHLQAMPNLQWLSLRNTKVTDEGVKHLRTLNRLDLENTQVTGAGLEHLPLRYLNLTKSQVTDSTLAHLKRCQSLRMVRVRDTKVTDEGVRTLQQALPNCRIDRGDNSFPSRFFPP